MESGNINQAPKENLYAASSQIHLPEGLLKDKKTHQPATLKDASYKRSQKPLMANDLKIPQNLSTIKWRPTALQGNIFQKVGSIFSLNKEKIPLITAPPSSVCEGQIYFNEHGKLSQGTKDCDLKNPEFKAENILEGVTIGGIEGSLTPIPDDCTIAASADCVATPLFPAVQLEGLASKVVVDNEVAGVEGIFLKASIPFCSADGEIACQTTDDFPALAVDGVASFLVIGNQLGGVSGTHSPDFPDPSQVLTTDTTNGAPGTVALPSISDVESGVAFGPSLGLTGTFLLPASNHVASGVAYGHALAYSGTAIIESHVDCSVNGSQGCIADDGFFAAKTCAANGQDDCYLDSTSLFDAANLTNLTAGNIKSGVTIAGQAGSLTIPNAADVKVGVAYGSFGSERIGTFTLPKASDVLSPFAFGAGGTEFTGAFIDPMSSNVKQGVSYGAAATEFTGTFVLPPATDVLSGVAFGNASEFSGSAIKESHVDCSTDGSQGCVANDAFFAARSCKANGDDDCFIDSASIFDAADLTNLDAGNIKAGITIAGQAGSLALPLAGQVEAGVSYGSNGNERIGNLTAPAISDVEFSIAYGAGGSEFTGTFKEPGASNVEAGVGYGAGGSEFTGTFMVPSQDNVASLLTYGHLAEFKGTATIESHLDCTVDGSQGCVANNTFFAARTCTANGDDDCFVDQSGALDAADLSALAAGNIKAGVTIAGMTGNLTIPLETDVELGVGYGSGGSEKSGAYKPPAAFDVLIATKYGAGGSQFTGTMTEPQAPNVKSGVKYGAGGTQFTGNFTLPAQNNVASGVSYGHASQFTGTATLESHVDCTLDGSQGCVANNAFFAARSCAANGADDCFAASSGPYDAADLSNLTAANIKSGVTIAGQAGNLTLPSAQDVELGVAYGSGGSERTGTYKAPLAHDVVESTRYGAGGTQFTGTFKVPGVSDVESGARYGAGGTEFTGNLVVPSSSNVASGVTYGHSSEFSGTANVESHTDCTVDGSRGCVAKSPFYAATACSSNGDNHCIARSASVYDAADLSNLAAGNIKAGVNIAGQVGNVTTPNASQVESGRYYGSNGNEKQGTFTVPAVSKVRSLVSYGAGGSEFTGTFTEPGAANVEAGVRYGAGGTQYTGSFVVPARGNVASGVRYGHSFEFTGTASVESHSNCTGSNQSGCVATSTYATMDKSAAGTHVGLTSGNFDSSIATLSNYEFWDAQGARHTITGDNQLRRANIRSGVEIHGKSGNMTQAPPNCSGPGQSNCVATNTFKTMNLSAAGSDIGLTAGNFDASIATSADYEFWDAGGDRHSITGDSDLRVTNVLSGVEIHGVTGNVVQGPANCTGANQSGCVATSTYKTMNLSGAGSNGALTAGNFDASIATAANYEFWDAQGSRHIITGDADLRVGNVKDNVEIHGVNGDYPSTSYRLPSASGVADLDSATFYAKIKSSGSFEYWASDGSYHVGSGDGDITAGNIMSGTDIYGVAGSAVAGSGSEGSTLCGSSASGWIYVPGDTDYGSSGFCVMEYEAKRYNDYAVSHRPDVPWTQISQERAMTECSALGTGFHLITNDEWMAVAAHVAGYEANWCNSSGTNCLDQNPEHLAPFTFTDNQILNRGHTDGSPARACDGTNEILGNSCDSLGSNFAQKRTHKVFSNSGMCRWDPQLCDDIWDLSGNVGEWTSYFIGSGSRSEGGTWTEYRTMTPGGSSRLPQSDLYPSAEVKSWWDNFWDSGENIGQYKPGLAGGGGGALYRGGHWSNGANAGVFTAHLGLAPTTGSNNVGFRCVGRKAGPDRHDIPDPESDPKDPGTK